MFKNEVAWNLETLNMSYILDLKSVSKTTIFGLKMMLKSGLEKIF